jgi:NitT/TauT family transport system substrate-binding protein
VIPWLVLLQTSLTIATAGPATAPEYWPLWIAQGEGYFAQEQLAVSLEPMRAETPAAEALARGKADLAATSLDAALTIGHVAGAPPKLVFGLTAMPPVALVVPAARKGAIRSVEDLVGKTIGVPAPGTPAAFALVSLLDKAGVRVTQVTVKSFGERGLTGAVGKGEIDAAILGDPYVTRLIEDGAVDVLADLRQRGAAARWLGASAVECAIFARADTKLDSTQLKPLARALLKALEKIRSATAEELRGKLPPASVGLPEDFEDRLRGAREIYLPDGRVTAETLQASVSLVRGRSPIPAKVKLPRSMDKLLLMGPLEEALGSPQPQQ